MITQKNNSFKLSSFEIISRLPGYWLEMKLVSLLIFSKLFITFGNSWFISTSIKKFRPASNRRLTAPCMTQHHFKVVCLSFLDFRISLPPFTLLLASVAFPSFPGHFGSDRLPPRFLPGTELEITAISSGSPSPGKHQEGKYTQNHFFYHLAYIFYQS
jgi:hypothetical protein